MRLLAPILFLAVVSAGFAQELRWSYVPVATFAEHAFSVSLRGAGPLTVEGITDPARVQASGEHAWDLTIDPRRDDSHIRIHSGGKSLSLHLLSNAAGLGGHALRPAPLQPQESEVVVLLAQRRGQARDRRYGWLRRLQSPSLQDWQVQWPQATPWGYSPLLTSLDAWSNDSANNCLLVLCHRDMQVGWSPEEYAAVLSWLLAVHQDQGQHVALLAPILHPAEAVQAQPLMRAIRQVAEDYAIPLIETDHLHQEAYWLIAPDAAESAGSSRLVGTWLNADGQHALGELLQTTIQAPVSIPAQGFAPAMPDATVGKVETTQ